jgi:hypothetical protein
MMTLADGTKMTVEELNWLDSTTVNTIILEACKISSILIINIKF